MLFMYSQCILFWRHRDFPDVALIALALTARGAKKNIAVPTEKPVAKGLCISFVPWSYTDLRQCLPLFICSTVVPVTQSYKTEAAVTQYSIVVQGLDQNPTAGTENKALLSVLCCTGPQRAPHLHALLARLTQLWFTFGVNLLAQPWRWISAFVHPWRGEACQKPCPSQQWHLCIFGASSTFVCSY